MVEAKQKLDPYTLKDVARQLRGMAKSCRLAATIPRRNITGFPNWAKECRVQADQHDDTAAYFERQARFLSKKAKVRRAR